MTSAELRGIQIRAGTRRKASEEFARSLQTTQADANDPSARHVPETRNPETERGTREALALYDTSR